MTRLPVKQRGLPTTRRTTKEDHFQIHSLPFPFAGLSVARVEGASFSSPSSPPVVGLDREASEEEVTHRGEENEDASKRRKKVVDWSNSESVSSGANSDGPENGT